ncbi:DUF882 domain-containing protein [Candidatus Liberibacter asiaticus]|uniref:Murein endopeptidase K n=2 Tax=Liberibacter asiaticus TaxID=34021 RepID=C6XGD1_LIBAP|nr:DUF882 domain-containing protein [Candidatus Liberibacter asiaticus]ACT57434.1 hypothetical protein CLIBASIA_04310 [Candidatus Liberibacter asiaticus str. psy62]AGH17198.1 hypothetical protein WSI_04140 [Candidatus Liberibacter asiaticus str. gxpsy]ALK07499.1 DUF882 domain-containing protein [Candidatus Liberibacter asiaticus]ASK52989.1 hypothetical protein B2I23_04285 [Candidatus Liberibacter asiaticus]AWL14316.1 DUF882 domain-containing protein [Candidatus Liberibacter asiaticus]
MKKTEIFRILKVIWIGLYVSVASFFVTSPIYSLSPDLIKYHQQSSMSSDLLDQEEVRTLKIYVVSTGSKAIVTFKRGSQYNQEGLSQLNRLLYDWHSKQSIDMDPQLFDFLWEIQQYFSVPEYIYILSGYRTQETNKMLSRRNRKIARKSQHVLGKAVDFYIPGVSLRSLYKIAIRLKRGGVGYYSKFLHIDVGRVRSWT